MIVPDLRGYGDSDLAPDDAYDLVHYSRDIHALVQAANCHQYLHRPTLKIMEQFLPAYGRCRSRV